MLIFIIGNQIKTILKQFFEVLRVIKIKPHNIRTSVLLLIDPYSSISDNGVYRFQGTYDSFTISIDSFANISFDTE